MQTEQTEDARRELADNLTHRAICDWIREDAPLAVKMVLMPEHVAALVRRLAALRSDPARDAEEEWQPIEQKPVDADWIIYLPDGAEDGLGWALDPDERLAALLWWEAAGLGRSEITHFRKPIAGPNGALPLPQDEHKGGADGP